MNAGLDIGSTTLKCAVLADDGTRLFSHYERHLGDPRAAALRLTRDLHAALGPAPFRLALTGSVGLGFAESLGLPFVQEMTAAAAFTARRRPDTRTLVDIGGEDTKMIFFHPGRAPEIRMNGSCAGGTGAFLDQMAALLDLPVATLDALAARATRLHPIASRCGVFAKTDVQSLLSRHVPPEEIAASIFHALALQTVNALGRGHAFEPPVLFSGGPLAFLPRLRGPFLRHMNLPENAAWLPDQPVLVSAEGAAWQAAESGAVFTAESFTHRLEAPGASGAPRRLAPLFESEPARRAWLDTPPAATPRAALHPDNADALYLGLDSGSTTTKAVLIDAQSRILFSHYQPNRGGSIAAARDALAALHGQLHAAGLPWRIRRACATGYGEDLVRAAFAFHDGEVETLAHFRAARRIEPNVSFILDIGGQDMKALFIRDGVLHHIAVNEACSSGCGSFVAAFAHTLDCDPHAFAERALRAPAPADLGARCTVFMNSRVRQLMREGVSLDDLAAGLACSVVKNCFTKVLRPPELAETGSHVVVQGGLFRNRAVRRALEKHLGAPVIHTDIPELMGAYGAALAARERDAAEPAGSGRDFLALANLADDRPPESRTAVCRGCANRCAVTSLAFPGAGVFHAGHRCERVFSNQGEPRAPGANLFEIRDSLLFNFPPGPAGPARPRIGIPRALLFYRSFPFWRTLLADCGFEPVLSAPSTRVLQEKAAGSAGSDNLCLPARLAHGHLADLLAQRVDRVLYPRVIVAEPAGPGGGRGYSCPIVAGYGDVLAAGGACEQAGIPFDQPTLNLADPGLRDRALTDWLATFGVPARHRRAAIRRADAAQSDFETRLRAEGANAWAEAGRAGRPRLILAGRPYHADPILNQQIPRMAAALGALVLPVDALPLDEHDAPETHVLSQWAYPHQLLRAARFAAGQPGVALVMLNSFGCGPDAVIADEVKAAAAAGAVPFALIRVDDMTAEGPLKLRLRSLIESLRLRAGQPVHSAPRPKPRRFMRADQHRTMLLPFLSDFHSPALEAAFAVSTGRLAATLPPADRAAVEEGLRHVNPDICYPAVIVIGSVLHAFRSGAFDPASSAVVMPVTGGQCRASNYLFLLRKALADAGLGSVPVAALAVGENGADADVQDAGSMPDARFLALAVPALLYGDALMALTHATAVRECRPGAARELANHLLAGLPRHVHAGLPFRLTRLVAEAVAAFQAIPMRRETHPQTVVVGEIFLKYNAFANHHVADWLIARGIEPLIPPMTPFFLKTGLNISVNLRHRIERDSIRKRLLRAGIAAAGSPLERAVERRLRAFPYYTPPPRIEAIAEQAQRALHLTLQFGEGWALPGEILAYADAGAPNAVCLQPFGCIANQVLAKGMEKKLRALRPELNLLLLDYDAGGAEVNQENRLHFFAEQAHQAQER